MTELARRWMRLRGFITKETLQIRRDPSSIVLALVMPVVLLFLFGFGVSLDAQRSPVAIVIDSPGPQARALVERFSLTRYFHPMPAASMEQATAMLNRHAVDAIVRVQSDFADRLHRPGAAPVQIIVNGTDSNRAQAIQAYAVGVLANDAAQRVARGESSAINGVVVEPRIWFNDAMESSYFLVPGLLALVMTLIGVLLTALVIAREWERGTMEAILATPLRPGEMMAAKLLPYFILGMMGMAMSVGLGAALFGVPVRGSLWVLVAVSALYLLASLGLGLFISAAARVQFIAAQVSIVIGFLPAFFLSGLLFDLDSTPWPIRAISHIIPARYFISAAHTLFLAGDVWPIVWRDATALGIMAAILIALARSRLGKRIER